MTPSELKAYRKSKGYTQEGFGRLFGRERTQVFNWENGNAPIPQYVISYIELSNGKTNPNSHKE